MDIKAMIKERHSVRQFTGQIISDELRDRIQELVIQCNAESGLSIQAIYDDPECFQTLLAHYGKFKNAVNYIALVGDASMDRLNEQCGYYGEKIVLGLQDMGLRSCWVGGTYGKGKCKADTSKNEKIVCVIVFGYGENDGVKHSTKPAYKLCNVKEEDMPSWFRNGMVAAMMAPTAINQQKFYITLDGEKVKIKAKAGPFSKVDLGIVRYHFEAVTGRKCELE
ncbi:MAG: nitroreductase [Eubacterium sp.]|nr:nitroreductase [Eubacterium sp.]